MTPLEKASSAETSRYLAIPTRIPADFVNICIDYLASYKVTSPVRSTGRAMTKIVPMLDYADAPGAIDFLCRAFGFKVTMRLDGDDGTVGHAELELDGASVALATAWRDGGFSTPQDLGGVHGQLWCEVADIDTHFQQARAAGAVIVGEPHDEDFGYRTYRAIDPEGHRWYFGTPRSEQ